MNIIVCVKHVPQVEEEELIINQAGVDIEKEDLVFDINEWDYYAVEEAIRIKEKYGGKITVITVGEEKSRDTLRKALAMGADEAILAQDERLSGSDVFVTARILHQALKNIPYDIILTGAQASDDASAAVGVTLAEMFGIPYGALVNKIDIEPDNKTVKIKRELEGNLNEVLDIKLPALFTIQTGINEPRYVSVAGIRNVKTRPIKQLSLEDLFSKEEAALPCSKLIIKKMSLPKVGAKAQILEGTPEKKAEELVAVLKEKGGIL